MGKESQIHALLHLIDDPDEEVFETVSEKLITIGKEIIPNLENLWEQTTNPKVIDRIEHLIHRVHFQDLQAQFFHWSKHTKPELLKGALLLAQYQYPDLLVPPILAEFDQIRRNIWLELNNYLTPLEQINVFNSLLYNFYKFNGHELAERVPDHFFINKLLKTREGNTMSMGVLFLVLADLLDVPLYAIDIPKQFVIAYIDTLYHFYKPTEEGVKQINYFIDPTNGIVYAKNDINVYLKKTNIPQSESFYQPLNSKQIMIKIMQELALCYQYKNENEKADEIELLIKIIKYQKP